MVHLNCVSCHCDPLTIQVLINKSTHHGEGWLRTACPIAVGSNLHKTKISSHLIYSPSHEILMTMMMMMMMMILIRTTITINDDNDDE